MLYYKMTCPDTVTYDWATVILKDNTAGTTATLLPKTCATNAWTAITGTVIAAHSYTLTTTSHDDNYSGDPSFTDYDDVTIVTGGAGGGTASPTADSRVAQQVGPSLARPKRLQLPVATAELTAPRTACRRQPMATALSRRRLPCQQERAR